MTTVHPSDNVLDSKVAPSPQRIGVPREIFPGEKRVATVPDVVTKLTKLGFAVVVEQGAGDLADLSDQAYEQAGAALRLAQQRFGVVATSSSRSVRLQPRKLPSCTKARPSLVSCGQLKTPT